MTKKIRQLKAKDVKSLRDHIHKKQKCRCLICEKWINKPVLDHHHTKRVKGTGLIRGVLCSNCNVFLAKSENNCTRYLIKQKDLPKILRSMAKYLEKKHYPYRHPSEAPSTPKLMKSSYNKLKKALQGTEFKCPAMSKSGVLTLPLKKAFAQVNIKPQFYGDKK